MAAADPPAGLMGIASTLPQDEIPMKLRCSICNTLAVNAFRLPCCDQSICENCQSTLSDTCLVCAHTPVSPDLCKPNKALRTTLKAYLRTEEKKREKERQAAAPPTPAQSAPAESEQVSTPIEAPQAQSEPAAEPDAPVVEESIPEDPATESGPAQTAESAVNVNGSDSQPLPEEPPAPSSERPDQPDDHPDTDAVDGEKTTTENPDSTETPEMPNQEPGAVNANAAGFPGMAWNGNGNFNGMNPYMANSMFNFNPMGMPMGMDPMTANQGMFGDYGMNMTGMGMNMGMNYDGQGMYGSLGWDGSQQNVWQGGQDKFNPNAFANGSGPPYGGAFGGPNMSYPPNGNFQSGHYGPAYGRGGFRGRGRGHFSGSGRGGFGGPGQGHPAHVANPGLPNRPGSNVSLDEANGHPTNGDGSSQAIDSGKIEPNMDASQANENPDAPSAENDSGQLQGIPTIDSLDESDSMGTHGYPGPGYGYGRGYMRGGMQNGRGGFWNGSMHQPHLEPRNPGVEGAPAAPRAMRQGLPNTSVLRHRGFHQNRPSVGSNMSGQGQSNPETPQDPSQSRPGSRAPSQAPRQESRSRSRSRSQSRSRSRSQRSVSRAPSPSRAAEEDRDIRRDYDMKRPPRRSVSPPANSSRRSSRHRHRDSDRERDRRSGRRSHRSRRHRSQSRSRSPTRNGDNRHQDRLSPITETRSNGQSRSLPEKINPRDLATRIGNSHRTNRDRPRREEDRDRESRHRDRDKDRERDRRGRDRDSDRDHRRDRDRERDRDRKDRKRSRRDRSESNNPDSHPRARRVKRGDETRDREAREAPAPEPEKDPHTLEREARNRERLLREQQRREQAKSGSRRDSRPDRVVAGRRINYKYEDEL